MARLTAYGPPLCQSLQLDDPTQWLQVVHDDLSARKACLPGHLTDMTPPQCEIRPSTVLWCSYPRAWKGLVSRYMKLITESDATPLKKKQKLKTKNKLKTTNVQILKEMVLLQFALPTSDRVVTRTLLHLLNDFLYELLSGRLSTSVFDS